MKFSPQNRQKRIYTAGAIGEKQVLPFDFKSLETQVKQNLKEEYFNYVATGAGTEQTIYNNEQAFNKYRIIPSMLKGKTELNTSIQLFGNTYPTPFFFAPIGALELMRKHAESDLAQASNISKVPMIISNQASLPMEQSAAMLGQQEFFFQLYFSKSKALVESFVNRAHLIGAKAIVLTVDTCSLGWRLRDLKNGFLPFSQGIGIGQYISDPVFQKLIEETKQKTYPKAELSFRAISALLKLSKQYPGNFFNNFESKTAINAVRTFLDVFSKTDLSWEDVRWLKSICKVPLIIKGILQPEDAKKAIEIGVDGLIISNHGGRQVDYSISSLEALEQIKNEIPASFPLLFDSGIRNASHAFIALARGATAVCVGRPYVYALALNGKQGLIELMENLIAEFELTMRLTGANAIADINPEKVVFKA